MFWPWKKDIIAIEAGGILWLSVVFSWMLPEAKRIADAYKGPVIIGGPAASTQRDKIDWAKFSEDLPWFEPLLLHNPMATFTTRGCLRACEFCVVSKVEGRFKELKEWRPAPIICDNNLTAASKTHFKRVVDSCLRFPYVDINQGMDARLFKPWHARELQRLQGVKIRFAFDDVNLEGKVADAFALAKKSGFRDFGCYVLIGFKDTPDEAKHKLEFVRSLGIKPMPMRFQPWNSKEKNSYVDKDNKWTHELLQDYVRYYANLARFNGIGGLEAYQEYTHGLRQKGWFY